MQEVWQEVWHAGRGFRYCTQRVPLRGLQDRADPCCEKRAQLRNTEMCVRFS